MVREILPEMVDQLTPQGQVPASKPMKPSRAGYRNWNKSCGSSARTRAFRAGAGSWN